MYSSPFRHSNSSPKGTFAYDLHVLATPPAFDLSQDQTLHLYIVSSPTRRQGIGFDGLKLVAGALQGRPGPAVDG